ncbi:MAG: sigma-70 family RNA polymerase sigma factor [Planctomycetaceae bacterium]|nr:sigma-70 family RNA polymerase sigma factor [Planctomycetaceae bacterium]MCB9949648.1 sigma-70 family RNA polymerase sigma factor [Planctomycetaceae bacterium]
MAHFPETSLSLITQVKDPANSAAWVEFLELYEPVVYRMARGRGLQDADAQDIVQQVFTSIAGAVDRWTAGEDRPPFRAWLTTIVRNAINKLLSRLPRDRASGGSSVLQRLHSEPNPDDITAEIAIETRRQIVFHACELIRHEFSEATWHVFWQTAVEGVSVAEVAKASGKSAGAIYVAKYRVIARLKESISHMTTDWDPEQVTS